SFILISRSRLYSPTTSSPGCGGVGKRVTPTRSGYRQARGSRSRSRRTAQRRVQWHQEGQAIFRRRHRARRPPPAKITPRRPAPAMGPAPMQVYPSAETEEAEGYKEQQKEKTQRARW